MTSSARQLLTRDALLLRGFALPLLAGHSPPRETVVHAARASEAAWSVFLRAEPCAVPLDRALERWDGAHHLPSHVRACVSAHAQVELQRIMVARWQLTRIDSLAARAGLQPCVIKGGVLLADESAAIDLGDIDLLVRPEDVDATCALLAELGMRRDPLAVEHEKHLPPFIGEGLVPVEVHPVLRYGPALSNLVVDRRPLSGFTALRRWTGPNAVVATVLHSLRHHPHRYGSLRDLLVVADALDELSPAQRTELDATVGQLPMADAIKCFIALASAVARGLPPRDAPAMRAVAALKYADLQFDGGRIGNLVRSRPTPRYLPLAVGWRDMITVAREDLGTRIRPAAWEESRLSRAPAAAAFAGRSLVRAWRAARFTATFLASIVARRHAVALVAAADREAGVIPAATDPAR